MLTLVGQQHQLGEDVADVLVDRAVTDHQGAGDIRVGPTFGHQCEHLPLTGGKEAGDDQRAQPGRQPGHENAETHNGQREPAQRVASVHTQRPDPAASPLNVLTSYD